MSEATESPNANQPVPDAKPPTGVGNMGAKLKAALAGEPAAPPAAAPAPAPATTPAPAAEAPKPAAAPPPGPKPIPDLKSVKGPEPAKSTEPAKEPAAEPITDATAAPQPATKITAQHFKALEAKRDEYYRKHLEAEAKLKEMESKLAVVPDVEKMKGELEEYQKIVSQYYLEKDPRFQAAFDAKIAEAVQDGKDAVGAELSTQAEQILRMPESTTKQQLLRDMFENLGEFERAGLRGAYDQIRRVQRERENELAKAKTNLEKVKEFDSLARAKETEERARQRMTFAEAQLAEAAQHLPEFQASSDNPEYSQIVNENVNMVKDWTKADLNPQQQAQMAVWAVRGFRSAERETAQLALIAKLQENLAKLQGAQPSVEGQNAPAQPGTPKEDHRTAGLNQITSKFRKALQEGIPS